jgi:hypothetical protein
VCLAGFLGLSTGLSGAASATPSSVAPVDRLSTDIATLPARSAAVSTSAVVTVGAADCAPDQLTALPPESCG